MIPVHAYPESTVGFQVTRPDIIRSARLDRSCKETSLVRILRLPN